jgi:hypothetical protein
MAWTDPYYQVDYVFDGAQQICLSCHIPLEDQQEHLVVGFRDREMFRPVLRPNANFDRSLREEGVTCAVCHVRSGIVIGARSVEGAPHPVKADPSMSSGIKPCERCHVVTGKRWDTFYTVPPCGTVAEIREKGQEPDCIGCHMPEREADLGAGRKSRRHLFRGGHDPETVAGALAVDSERLEMGDGLAYRFTLTNRGAAHYLPTGTPDRHLTLEFRLFDSRRTLIKEEMHTMKRYILWRPFIVDLRDTRLPYGEPRHYTFAFNPRTDPPPATLEVTVRYHLLDEKRRKKIGYDNKEPISYEIYRAVIAVEKE